MMKRMLGARRALVLAICFGVSIAGAPAALAQLADTVLRLAPTVIAAGDAVTLTASGAWPTSCIPYRTEVLRSASTVDVLLLSPPDDVPTTVCLSALRPWSMEVDLGRFSAGSYTVSVRFRNGTTLAPQRFTVTGATLVTPSNVSDAWLASAEPGWGIVLNEQAGVTFATWYVYQAGGTPLWLVMPAGRRVTANRIEGDLYTARGTPPDLTWEPANHATTASGRASLELFGNARATLTYTFNNRPVMKSLTRFTYAPQRLATTTYAGTFLGEVGACTVERGSFALARYYDLTLTPATGSTLALRLVDRAQIGDAQSPICTFIADATQAGASISAEGTFTCTQGNGDGTFTINDLRVSDDFINFDLTYRRAGCEIGGRAAAVRATQTTANRGE